MDDKKAMQLLLDIVKKYPVTVEEKEALDYTIGLLSWTSLRSGAVKSMREKQLAKKRRAIE